MNTRITTVTLSPAKAIKAAIQSFYADEDGGSFYFDVKIVDNGCSASVTLHSLDRINPDGIVRVELSDSDYDTSYIQEIPFELYGSYEVVKQKAVALLLAVWIAHRWEMHRRGIPMGGKYI